MPKTIPLVSELEWKATGKDDLEIEGLGYSRHNVSAWSSEMLWRITNPAYFTESCRQKLLSAMDSYGKVEERECWKVITQCDKYYTAECLLELRQRIESLEGKK